MGKNFRKISQLMLYRVIFSPCSWSVIDHVTIACPSRIELRSNNRSILVFVSLERVILSIFRYLKQPANELPQPADVPSVPASTIVAVNRTVASTSSKKASLELQSL